jgi:hypothetical protein
MSDKQFEFTDFVTSLINDLNNAPRITIESFADQNFKALKQASEKIQELETDFIRECAYIQQLTETITEERELYNLALTDIQIRDFQIENLEMILEELQEENEHLRTLLQDNTEVPTTGNDVNVELKKPEPEATATSVFKDFYETSVSEQEDSKDDLLMNIIRDLQRRVIVLESGYNHK